MKDRSYGQCHERMQIFNPADFQIFSKTLEECTRMQVHIFVQVKQEKKWQAANMQDPSTRSSEVMVVWPIPLH